MDDRDKLIEIIDDRERRVKRWKAIAERLLNHLTAQERAEVLEALYYASECTDLLHNLDAAIQARIESGMEE